MRFSPGTPQSVMHEALKKFEAKVDKTQPTPVRPPPPQPRMGPTTPQVSRPPPPQPRMGPTTPQVSRPPMPVRPSVPLPGQPKFMGEGPGAMKKGGYVTKHGSLNLGSGRVSTAVKSKKNPNF